MASKKKEAVSVSAVGKEKEERFRLAQEKIIGAQRLRPTIGTLSEKTVHAVLKCYLDPDEDHHEIPLGSYVADIYRAHPPVDPKTGERESTVIEVQTRAFSRMKGKLTEFLQGETVTIAHPIIRKKTLVWIDPETGEITERRKSPKKENYYTVFQELYSIRDYLKHPNLRIKLIFMEAEEYKILDGYGAQRKHHATKYDRIPTALLEEIDLLCPEDYMQFLPENIPDRFTAADFAKIVKISKRDAGFVLGTLRILGIIDKIGKAERGAYLYRCNY